MIVGPVLGYKAGGGGGDTFIVTAQELVVTLQGPTLEVQLNPSALIVVLR